MAISQDDLDIIVVSSRESSAEIIEVPDPTPQDVGAPLGLRAAWEWDEHSTRPLYRPPTPIKDEIVPNPTPRTLPKERDQCEWKAMKLVPDSCTLLKELDMERVSFFPYPHMFGLDDLLHVFAVAGKDSIHLCRLWDLSTQSEKINASQLSLELLCSITNTHFSPSSIKKPPPSKLKMGRKSPKPEEPAILALEWSVKLTTWPYTPLLAVAGRGNRQIFIYEVAFEGSKFALHLTRTLNGHGMTIRDLSFSATHPHLLASASDDSHISLWDVNAPGGSDRDLTNDSADHSQSNSEQVPYVRPVVPGEYLGRFSISSHRGGVLSIDIHPRKPYLVSSGFDSMIRIWEIQKDLLPPTWPSDPPLLEPEPNLLPPRTLGPPIHSSAMHHPGVWCDQVLWASHDSTWILSKAQEGQPMESNFDLSSSSSLSKKSKSPKEVLPKKIIKLWRPTILKSERNGPQSRDDLFSHPKVASPLAFDTVGQIIIDDQNFISDKMAIYRPSSATPRHEKEVILAVQNYSKGSLDVFHPLTLDSVLPSTLTSPQWRSSKEQNQVKTLFPDDRDRDRSEYTPPIESRTKVEKALQKRHLRSVAIDPTGGKYLVGVGRGGVVQVWRRGEAERETEGEGEEDDEDATVEKYLTNEVKELNVSSGGRVEDSESEDEDDDEDMS